MGLFQEMCLVNGEILSWTFDHSARTSGGAPTNQTVVYEVVDSSGTLIQALDTSTVTEMGSDNDQTDNLWAPNTGSATYTGSNRHPKVAVPIHERWIGRQLSRQYPNRPCTPSSCFRLQRHLPSRGHLVLVSDFRDLGRRLSTVTVTVEVNPSSTATEGVDFTITNKTITIPPGTYDGVSSGSLFEVPFNVPTDSEVEPDETVILEIASVTAADPSHTPVTVSSQTACDNSTTPTSIHTILEPSVDLSVSKTLLTTGLFTSGQTIEYTIVVTNSASSTTTATNVAIEAPANQPDKFEHY